MDIKKPFVIKSWKRKFDSNIQKSRPPVKDLDKFNELWSSAANALMLHKDTKTALDLLDKAIQMEPMRAIPWTIKAQAHGLDGRFSEALKAIGKALEIDPSDPDKWELKASFLKIIGRMEDAQKCSEEANRLRSS